MKNKIAIIIDRDYQLNHLKNLLNSNNIDVINFDEYRRKYNTKGSVSYSVFDKVTGKEFSCKKVFIENPETNKKESQWEVEEEGKKYLLTYTKSGKDVRTNLITDNNSYLNLEWKSNRTSVNIASFIPDNVYDFFIYYGAVNESLAIAGSKSKKKLIFLLPHSAIFENWTRNQIVTPLEKGIYKKSLEREGVKFVPLISKSFIGSLEEIKSEISKVSIPSFYVDFNPVEAKALIEKPNVNIIPNRVGIVKAKTRFYDYVELYIPTIKRMKELNPNLHFVCKLHPSKQETDTFWDRQVYSSKKSESEIDLYKDKIKFNKHKLEELGVEFLPEDTSPYDFTDSCEYLLLGGSSLCGEAVLRSKRFSELNNQKMCYIDTKYTLPYKGKHLYNAVSKFDFGAETLDEAIKPANTSEFINNLLDKSDDELKNYFNDVIYKLDNKSE